MIIVLILEYRHDAMRLKDDIIIQGICPSYNNSRFTDMTDGLSGGHCYLLINARHVVTAQTARGY